MNPRYGSVAVQAGHQCEYCHAPEAIFNFPFEVEHIIPSSVLREWESRSRVTIRWQTRQSSCS